MTPETQPRTREWRDRLRGAIPHLLIGAAIGTVAMLLATKGVDWTLVRVALRETSFLLAALSVGCVAVSVLLGAVRWWLLFTPDHRERELLPLVGAILVGQTVNTALPGRVGELARMYLIGRREGLSSARVMATIVVEKVTDFTMFALSILLLVISMSLPDWMDRSGEAFLTTAFVVVVVTLTLTFWSDRLLSMIERVAARFPVRWSTRIVRFAEAALGALRALRDWKIGLAVWILAAAILVFSILTNYLVFLAMGLQLGPVAALLLSVVLRIGSAPPSLPGKLGVFQYLVVLALGVLGVEKNTGLGVSIVLYLVAVVPVLVAGAASGVAFRWLPRGKTVPGE